MRLRRREPPRRASAPRRGDSGPNPEEVPVDPEVLTAEKTDAGLSQFLVERTSGGDRGTGQMIGALSGSGEERGHDRRRSRVG